MEIAVNGAYSSLQLSGLYGLHLASIPEMRSDNATLSWMQGDIDREEIIRFEIKSTNPIVNQIWSDAYESILRCNIVLDRIDGIEMDQALRERNKGEVKFLRALNYFNLVRIFGEVPIVLKEVSSPQEGYDYTRKPVEEIYEQIITDLEDAEQNLPISYPDNEVGRATQGAAKALLGKVYLTNKDYQAAETKLKEVMDMGVYELLPDYTNLWNLSNENSAESIFEIQYTKGGLGVGSRYANAFAPKFSSPQVVSIGGASGFNSPTQDMEDAYEADDLRKDISLASGYYNANGEFVPDKYTKKFLDVPFADDDADNNWIVLRYADVMLMYAEVLNEINNGPTMEAYNMINQIRDRADLDPLNGLDYESFSLALEHERRVELAFEGHRWFDLIRTGRAVEVMTEIGYDVEEYQTLFPVPQSQIDINPDGIWQNQGYFR